MLNVACCQGCLSKMVEIDRLKAERNRLRHENARLKKRLGRVSRTINEAPFGSSTPSSKLTVKRNSTEHNRRKMGGAQQGHRGYGRTGPDGAPEAVVRRMRCPNTCPDCGTALRGKGVRRRLVVDCEPMRKTETVYELERGKCPGCGRSVAAEAPGVLPKCLYGNRLLSHVAAEHYLNGMTLGQLEQRTGIGCGSLIDALHQLARRLEPVMPRLADEYRAGRVRRADETTWREDGFNGYAWLFASADTSRFRFRVSRSSDIPREVFGGEPLPGVLVVDRYASYNVAPCDLQYCYAHLLRDVEDLGKEFPDDPQVAAFTDALAPELAAAMHLHSLKLSDAEYLRRARDVRSRILAVVEAEANHPGVQNIQSIFRENAHRLYHWVENRNVPADNNATERELRPLVIARKLSFGSQSPRGRHTREVLMSILHTLRKRTRDPAAALHHALNALAADPNADISEKLFGTGPDP
jgi:transposase